MTHSAPPLVKPEFRTLATVTVLVRDYDERQSGRIGDQTGGRVGFFLETDDIARDFERMRARGVEFRDAPRPEPYGTVAVFANFTATSST